MYNMVASGSVAEANFDGYMIHDSLYVMCRCPFCGKATVPFLTVNVIDYRAHPMVEHGSSQESISRGKAEKSNLGENVVAVFMLICLDSV
jgi:hypothetical protein